LNTGINFKTGMTLVHKVDFWQTSLWLRLCRTDEHVTLSQGAKSCFSIHYIWPVWPLLHTFLTPFLPLTPLTLTPQLNQVGANIFKTVKNSWENPTIADHHHVRWWTADLVLLSIILSWCCHNSMPCQSSFTSTCQRFCRTIRSVWSLDFGLLGLYCNIKLQTNCKYSGSVQNEAAA